MTAANILCCHGGKRTEMASTSSLLAYKDLVYTLTRERGRQAYGSVEKMLNVEKEGSKGSNTKQATVR